MKVKKVLLSITAMIIASSILFTGCGKKNETTGANGEYTIDWYHVTGSVPGNVKDIEKAADEYLKDKVGVKLKLHYLTWAQYEERLNLMTAGGDKFDIAHDASGAFLIRAARNAYLPLDGLLEQYAPKTKEMLGEDFLNGARVDGKLYGIPANKDKGQHFGILYRTDIAEKHNLTEELNNIKEYDDLYPIMDKMKGKDTDVIPLYEDNIASTVTLLCTEEIAFPAVIFLEKGDNKVTNLIESPEYEEALDRIWYNRQNGYTAPGYTDGDENAFIRFGGMNAISTAEKNALRKYKYADVPMTNAYMRAADTVGSINAISRTCEHPDKALQVLELFNTDKYFNNLIVYGIENVNYKKTGDNSISIIENSGYGNAGMQWEFGNVFLNYTTDGEDPEKHKILDEYNKTLIPSPTLGFHFNADNVKTEMAACSNIRTQYEVMLHRGDADPSVVLEEYRTKLRAAGSERIMAEVQAQYEAWLASK